MVYGITSCLVEYTCECVLLCCRLVPLSMLVSWEARDLMPTRQLSLVTLLVTHSRTLQAHLSTFSSSSWLLSLWCLPHSSRLTLGRASSSSTSMLEFKLWRVCHCKRQITSRTCLEVKGPISTMLRYLTCVRCCS